MCSKKLKDKKHPPKRAENCACTFMFLAVLLHVLPLNCKMHVPGLEQFSNISQNIHAPNFVVERSESTSVSCEQFHNSVSSFSCTVTSFDREALIIELEKKYDILKEPMTLRLYGAPFNKTFRKADLAGGFELSFLEIYECDGFFEIEDYAFDKPSFKYLTELDILLKEDSGIEVLNEKTFKGLENLKLLSVMNTVSPKELTANGFLTPLADHLEKLQFRQLSEKDSNGYDPREWFADAIYPKLRTIDFARSYFPGTFSERTFENVNYVEHLHLDDCSIEYIEDNTFAAMIETLKYLNLRDNKLKALSNHLLQMLSDASVTVILYENDWDCSCNNENFVALIKEVNINLLFDPKCATPEKWKNHEIKTVELCCHDSCTQEEDDDSTTSTTPIITTTASDQTTDTVQESTPETSAVESHKIILYCKSPPSIALQDQLTYFNISSITATSVLINFKHQVPYHDLLYFTPLEAENGHQRASIDANSLIIEALFTGSTYVFCLIGANAQLVTPFNCRSHLVGQLEKVTWLSLKQRPPFLGGTISVAIICFITTMLLVYFFKRKKVISLLKPFDLKSAVRTSLQRPENIHDKDSNDDLGNCAPSSTENSDDYLKYISGAALPTKKIEVEIVAENKPPVPTAPERPHSESSYSIASKANYADDMRQKSTGYVKHKRTSELSAMNSATKFTEFFPPISRAPALLPLHAITLHNIVDFNEIKGSPIEHEYESLDDFDTYKNK